jgi:hypothetical protein
MPARKVSEHWRGRIQELAGAEGEMTSRDIQKKLIEEAQALGEEAPSDRYIRRLLQQSQGGLPLFYWPEAAEKGHLPWEASRVALEVQRYYARTNLNLPPHRFTPFDFRPSLLRVQWHWRLHLAGLVVGAEWNVWDGEHTVKAELSFWDRDRIVSTIVSANVPGANVPAGRWKRWLEEQVTLRVAVDQVARGWTLLEGQPDMNDARPREHQVPIPRREEQEEKEKENKDG